MSQGIGLHARRWVIAALAIGLPAAAVAILPFPVKVA
jgi:hypothetical protein